MTSGIGGTEASVWEITLGEIVFQMSERYGLSLSSFGSNSD